MATTIEGAIYSRLAAAAAVTSIVPTSRIFLGLFPENIDWPAIRYQRFSTTRVLTTDDTVNLVDVTVGISCFSKDTAQAKTLAKAILDTLHGASGTWDGIKVQRSTQESETDLPEEDTGVYHIIQVFRVLFEE